MKGFIEITNTSNELICLANVINIYSYISGNYRCKIIMVDDKEIPCKESYEEIKELIKQAQ